MFKTYPVNPQIGERWGSATRIDVVVVVVVVVRADEMRDLFFTTSLAALPAGMFAISRREIEKWENPKRISPSIFDSIAVKISPLRPVKTRNPDRVADAPSVLCSRV